MSSLASTNVLHENARLRILDAWIEPGHVARHSVPTVRWPVLDAGQPTPPPTFYPGGTEVTIGNPGQAGRREIVFEILQEPQRSEAEVERLVTAPKWPTAPGQVLMLENSHVRMWDFRASLGMDRNDFHQHVLDNAWVVLGGGSALDVFEPDGRGGAAFVKTLTFNDGFVSWNQVRNGGFDEDCLTPLQPSCVHSVENAGEAEFREYLIELK
ncbi:unnamed protein product [Polarella glacialis]|uniref:Uncharacterized protein n=1 Tax=Polarella glacialis TaxID=89957 RepID=A0A813EYY5_POLGL|nr:unnamed protein product [Polarella glacialis]|mmetsp:Transcript_4335/g.6922  ORF Transcript_4335/g.6922 Transcript_4335/m.6922 type:complete len:212 (+) Transcript_4335:121-756(+)